ncbi:hypothetical protein O988_02082 [Pseudogymnoascus sp. VKM F-3808]|nr:hypothetical protein O988_02082 [Pseudogymnoascus sp. VKM F-3808]
MDGTATFDARPIDSSQDHSARRHLVDRSFNELPLEVVASEGNYLYLKTGQMVFDATCGAAVSCLGHSNQEVIEAITYQLRANAYSNSILFTTAVATQLADEIILGTNNLMSRVYICSSGSEATEAAMKMARHLITAIPSAPFLCLATMVAAKNAEFQRLGPDTVIAFVCEPISGAALGCIPYVRGYLPAMKAVCRKYGALFILDETMCGMGRSGNLHAWQGEHVDGDVEQDCLPDLQMIGKGLGGGYQPIAGVIVGKDVVQGIKTGTGCFIHGQTYQAHPIACAASLAVQRIIRLDGLLSNVQKRGLYLSDLLRKGLGSHRNVGDIRREGLFWGIEFVDNKETKVPFRKASNVANTISEIALEFFKITLYPSQGTSNGVDGDHLIVAPAYNITGADVDHIVHQLVSAVDAFFSRQAWDKLLSTFRSFQLEPKSMSMDPNRREVQQIQGALRNSKEAQEAISTLMDGPLHWSLDSSTLSCIIFRVAATYRMLIEDKSTADGIVPGCNPEWAIDVIKDVSKTAAFSACDDLPETISLTNLPEAICDAFGSLISLTLLATENKRLLIKKSEMPGVLEKSEWLDAEQESHALWHEYEEIITELDIDNQTNQLNQLHQLITNGVKKIHNQEKQLDTEKEALRRATEHLPPVPTKSFLFERKQVQFMTSQIKMLEERHDIQKHLQDIRKEEHDRLELRFKKSEELIAMQQGLCHLQGVMDDNGNFKQPSKGSDCPADSE